MSTATRIIKNTGFLYVRTIVSLLVSVFTTRYLLEGLGADDFGIYNVVGGAISMLGFLSASMGSATQRFISYAEGQGDRDRVVKVFNNALLIHNRLALISVAILLVAGLFFFNGVLNIPDGKLHAALCVYGCLIFSTAFSVTVVPYDATINAHENMLYYSLLGIADVLLKFLIAIAVLFVDGEKLIIYAVLMALEALAVRLASQIYCRLKYAECAKPDTRTHRDKAVIKEMLSFTGWNMTNICTGMISLFGMNLVINHYFGVELNAAMGVATQLSGVLMGMSENMIKAITPVLVKSEGGKKRDRMISISLLSCRYSFLLFALFGLPVIVYLKPILCLWLTSVPEWTEPFCQIMIINALLNQMTVVLHQAISAEGHIKNYNIARSISNIVPIILSVTMYEIADLNPCWILINWLVWKSIIGGMVNVYYAHRNVGISIYAFLKKVVGICVLVSLSSYLILLFTYRLCEIAGVDSFVSFVIGGILTLPVYILMACSSSHRKSALLLIKSKLSI